MDLILLRLVSTQSLYILKQTYSFQLQVLVDTNEVDNNSHVIQEKTFCLVDHMLDKEIDPFNIHF